MAPPVFGDLYKSVKDLLTKGYNGDSQKLEIKGKAFCGGVFNPTLKFSPDGKLSETMIVEGQCPMTGIKLKSELVDDLFTLKATVVDSVLKQKLPKGLKVEGMVAHTPSKGEFALSECKVELKQTVFAADALVKDCKKLTTSVVVEVQNVAIGGQAVCDIKSRSLSSYSVAGEVKVAKSLLACIWDGKALKAGAFTVYKGWNFAAENVIGKTSFLVGVERKFAAGNVLKAKTDIMGKAFGVSWKHVLTPQLSVTASTEYQALSKAKFGMSFLWE